MNNIYAGLMKAFFATVDSSLESSPEELAIKFANFFVEGRGRNGVVVSLPKEHLYNVSIVARNTSLPFLTKMVPLVADTTVLTHYREQEYLFYEFEDSLASWGADKVDTRCYLRCPSLYELGKWLIDCKPLLLQGDIFYFPDILNRNITETRYDDTGYPYDTEESIGTLCDFIVTNRNISEVLTRRIAKSQLVRPILQIDLPYLDNVDLKTFSKITADEKESLDRFRDFLRIKFLELRENEGNENLEANLAKIGAELRDGVRGLNSDYNALKRKTAFQVTGAMVAATSAVLVAVNGAVFGLLPQIVGTSGGLLAIAKILEEHFSKQHDIQDNPNYYLWLFYRETSSH